MDIETELAYINSITTGERIKLQMETRLVVLPENALM